MVRQAVRVTEGRVQSLQSDRTVLLLAQSHHYTSDRDDEDLIPQTAMVRPHRFDLRYRLISVHATACESTCALLGHNQVYTSWMNRSGHPDLRVKVSTTHPLKTKASSREKGHMQAACVARMELQRSMT